MDQEVTHLHHTHNHSETKSISKSLVGSLFHSHSHEPLLTVNPSDNTDEGIRAVKISFFGLMFTAILQIFVVFYTQSVALFADTVHNFSDAFTSIPLWLAFIVGKRKKNSKYNYGYGRAEDLAGLLILLIIAGSAVLVFVESFIRFLNPSPPEHLFVLGIAAIVGFLGNEAVAQYRIRIGTKIGSEALIADGMHSRTDGIVSLSVLIGAVAAYFGYPLLDPILGCIIGIMILFILKDTAPKILFRLMDSVEPSVIEEIRHETSHIKGVSEVKEVRARWVGRSVITEIRIMVNRDFTVAQSHEVELGIEQYLNQKYPVISQVSVSTIPCNHHLKDSDC